MMTASNGGRLGTGVVRLLAAAGVCTLTACDSSVTPHDASPPVVPTEAGSALFVVSSPVHAAASGLSSVLAEQTAGPTVAYVSMAPGSIPNGSSATITVERTRATVFALLKDGGLDPVPIAAVAGDTIAVAVQTFNGGTVALRIAVPPAAPPVIVRTDPPKRKRDVPLNARIVIVFSEPIDVASLPGTVELRHNGARVAGQLAFIDDVRTSAQFVPTQLLDSETDYTLTVTQGIRNVGGLALPSPLSVDFTTVAVPPPLAGSPPVASVVITPDAVAVPHYSGLQLTATTRDAQGHLLTGRTVTWSSSNQTVAGISLFGFVAGSEPGPATITAMSEGIAGTAVIAITSDPVATVEVTPTLASILTLGHVGASQVQMTATPRNAQGAVVTGRQAQWTSSDNNVALAFGTGMVRGNAPGAATITATVSGVQGHATVVVASTAIASITVSPSASNIIVGGQQQLTATLKDAIGVTVQNQPVTWTTNNATIATVTSTGLVRGVGVGTATITATVGGVSTTAMVVVASNIVATVSVAPSVFNIGVNGETPLTATAWNATGTALPGHAITWASRNPAVATVSATGLVHAASLGTTSITATIDNITGEATVTVVPPLIASAVSGGSTMTCALTPAGVAYCWGNNQVGALGDGSYDDRFSPTAVYGGLTFTALAAGNHSCGIAANGAAYCWGASDAGALGSATISMAAEPNPVAGGLTFTSIGVGYEHTCALATTGVAYCWGFNGDGELGDGTGVGRATPVAVAGGLTFTSITTGAAHTCGVTASGDAYCWGSNRYHAVGDGSVVDHYYAPVAVATGLKFTRLVAGSDHTCGLTVAGAAYCWGYNVDGELGDGTTTDRTTPVAVLGLGGRVFSSLVAGAQHTCGISNGIAYCWGANFYGALGDGSNIDRYSPVAVAGNLTFASLTAGYDHTCGVSTSGAVYCWGYNEYGQLGDASFLDQWRPVTVLPPVPPQ